MIPVTNPYNNWQGDNSTTKFDFDFLVENQSQLLVFVTAADTVRQLTYETDYTITGFGNNNGGYITYPINEENDKLQNDETITLQLFLPITQQSEYGTSSELNPKDIEHSLDYLTRIAQIQNRQLERSVKVAEGSGTDTEEIVKSINTICKDIDTINAVNNNKENINAVNNNKENINTVASNLPLIEKAPINAQNAQIWAEGSDEQVQAIGGTHSAKTWNKIIDKNSYADKSLSNLNAEGLSNFGLKEGRDYIKLQDTDVDVPTASTIAGLTFVEID